MIKEFKRGDKTKISKNFIALEFDCNCNKCDITVIDLNFVKRLQKLRDFINKPIIINSGFRCSQRQLELKQSGYKTAKNVSQHEIGRAVDITIKDDTINNKGIYLKEACLKCGFKSIGVGLNFVHLDARRDKFREWSY